MTAQRILLRLLVVLSIPAAMALTLTASRAAGFGADPPKPASAASAADLAVAAEEVLKSLEATIATPQAFKAGAEECEHKGYVIALLANAVAEADGDAKWKANALAVRDAALGLAKTKSQPNAAQSAKEIQSLLSGAGGGAGKPMQYLEVSPLQQVMKEVNDRNRALTRNTKSTAFNRSKEAIARDAQVLALLGAVARTDTKSAEKAKKPQADFEKFADDLVTNSKSLAAAAKKGDQSGASDAYKAVKKACADCHAVYRPDLE